MGRNPAPAVGGAFTLESVSPILLFVTGELERAQEMGERELMAFRKLDRTTGLGFPLKMPRPVAHGTR